MTPLLLEVIVTSREEAVEAEKGGADRLEVVRDLEHGGLTPETSTVTEILEAVSIPVRVMVRERDALEVESGEELRHLQDAAQAFRALPIDGLVLGFLTGSQIDKNSLERILSTVPRCRGTFHRAFERVASPQSSLETLKKFPQIDRVLVRLDDHEAARQIRHLIQWQEVAAPEIKFVVGIGLEKNHISHLKHASSLSEIHVGRLVREPEAAWGGVSRRKIAELKGALG